LLALPTRKARERFLAKATSPEIRAMLHDWAAFARPEQLPPAGAWSTWLFLGGRGAGKTRAGAEWVRALAGAPGGAGRIALVGETFADVADTMIDGISGILAVHPRGERPRWERTRKRLVWPGGTIAQTFSSEDPEGLRGPEFAAAWCDELAKWRHPDETWSNLRFGLRAGDGPRALVTTTPRPVPLLKAIAADPASAITRAATFANAAFLAEGFVDEVVRLYGGTRLGRQEIEGEIVDDRADALWNRAVIEENRVRAAPALRRIVVAVDPAMTGRRTSDACGIVAAGAAEDGTVYVLEDATIAAVRPEVWAAHAIALYRRLSADALVVEVNQGGDLVASLMERIDAAVPVRPVRATHGKWLRAEPVALMTAQGRVKFAGAFPALEDELCDFGRDGLSGRRSPDRLDAFVWAATALTDTARPGVRVV